MKTCNGCKNFRCVDHKKTKTYNQYLTEQAQLQANNGRDTGGLSVMKVRRPEKGEVVEKYTNLAEVIVKQTPTEEALNEKI